MGTTRPSGGRMFSSTRRLRPRLSIPALISCFSGQQRQLKCEVLVGSGADATGLAAAPLNPMIASGPYRGSTRFDQEGAVAIDSS